MAARYVLTHQRKLPSFTLRGRSTSELGSCLGKVNDYPGPIYEVGRWPPPKVRSVPGSPQKVAVGPHFGLRVRTASGLRRPLWRTPPWLFLPAAPPHPARLH